MIDFKHIEKRLYDLSNSKYKLNESNITWIKGIMQTERIECEDKLKGLEPR